MKLLAKLEKKLGKYAIKHLTRYIILFYVAGYVLDIITLSGGPSLQVYLGLVPGLILKGQIWRLFTWWLMPPTELSIFTFLLLFCYYQLGSTLEKIWGDFYYNVYIFTGLIMTVVGAFVMHYCGGALMIELTGGMFFTTYYVSLSIFFAFAVTFPDMHMLLFFFIPIKIKYLALVDAAYLTFRIIVGNWMDRCLIISSLAATIVFFLLTGLSRWKAYGRREAERGRKMRSAGQAKKETAGPVTIHKCAVCGRTEKDAPDLEFRYCSKCSGNREYCSDHLFSHTHV